MARRSRSRKWATASLSAGSRIQVGAVGGRRHVAALDLVLALGAGLDPPEAVADRVVDGLVVAGLEMQELEAAHAAPIAAVEHAPVRLNAEKI